MAVFSDRELPQFPEAREPADAAARVQRMEELFDMLTQALDETPERIATDAALIRAARDLSAYQSGGEWLIDYQLDELGLLPASLKRGVLSQDGLYDLLCSPEVEAALAETQAGPEQAE